MNVLQENRISDRKISAYDFNKRIAEHDKAVKKLRVVASNYLSKLNIENHDAYVDDVLSVLSFVNLKAEINIYDKANSYTFTDSVNDDIDVTIVGAGGNIKRIALVNTKTKESIIVPELSEYISPWDELALDIYKGCPTFDPILCTDYMNNAVKAINEAYNGVTYRRDIFTCETLGIKFIPLEILSLGVQMNKCFKYIPYVTGVMIRNGSVQPMVMELSLARVCKDYHNEFIFDDGKCLDLSKANNLAISIIQPKLPEGFKLDIYKSVHHLTRAKIDKLKTTSFDAFECLVNLFDKVVWVDDSMRMLADKISIPQFVTK